MTKQAEERAVRVFQNNLKALLLTRPVRGEPIVAVDPGFKHGCKLAVIDAMGNVKAVDTVYPHPPRNDKERACSRIAELMLSHDCTLLAIGNGTACRETEALISSVKSLVKGLRYTIVNEAGASVYSASEVAENELTDMSVPLRSAVCLARRLAPSVVDFSHFL